MKDAKIPASAESPRRGRTWWRWTLGCILVIWSADAGISFLVQHTRLRQIVNERVEITFGRPVEVGRYSFSLWGGPSLVANSITVEEDPRFGQEYFLRADSMTIRLSWQGLLRGRLDPGTLSLSHPSLNLVRSAAGVWNLESWLPRPSAGGPGNAGSDASSSRSLLRLRRINIDSGRLNFKRGVDKLAFAFVGVSGYLEQERPGQWWLDLETQPYRVATVLQQSGTLHLAGHLGGTSSRLRPAELEISWRDASLSDVLRLARGYDYGVRGVLSVVAHARTEGAPWNLQVSAELREIHRWDLAVRSDNPALDLEAAARWWPEESRLELGEATIEAPRSKIGASGVLSWQGVSRRDQKTGGTKLELASPGIEFDDLMAWLRAFHPGMAQEASIRGRAGLQITLTGWPPQLDHGRVTAEGAELEGGSLRQVVHLKPCVIDLGRGSVHLAPVTLTIGGSETTFRVEALAERGPEWVTTIKAAGQVADVRELMEEGRALGFELPRGWGVSGGAGFELQWRGTPFPSAAQPIGVIQTPGLTVRAPFLNSPLTNVKGRMELLPGGRRVTLGDAQGFGARWKGTFEKRGLEAEWHYVLHADRMNAGELDHWLNPRRREGFLERVLPFLGSPSPPAPVPIPLRARGRLEIDHFELASLELNHLRVDSEIEGRRIELTNGRAEFYGGTLEGALRAELGAVPSYNIHANFSRVNLAMLDAARAAFEGRFGGVASGEASFTATGIGREALSRSLECRGRVQANELEMRGWNLEDSLREGAWREGKTEVAQAEAAFSCASGKVSFTNLRLRGPKAEYVSAGSVDYDRNLDLRLQRVKPDDPGLDTPEGEYPEVSYHLFGPLFSPQITPQTAAARLSPQ